jgi:hypothetical protein
LNDEDAERLVRAVVRGEADPSELSNFGVVMNPADLSEYDPEALATLRDQLEQSVQQRIAKTVELGSDYAHSARIAEQQQLIRSINKYLAEHPPRPR